MAANPKLNLPTCFPVAIFRRIDHRLRNDPVLHRTVNTWMSWEGGPDDRTPPSIAQTPCVQLTPMAGEGNPWAASTLTGPLRITVDMEIQGSCVDDMINLWFAVMRAIYAADQAVRLQLQRDLQSDGAFPGDCSFGIPNFVDSGNEATMKASGTITIAYRFDLNPTTPGF